MREYLLETVTGKTYRFKLEDDFVEYFSNAGIDDIRDGMLRVICEDGMERTFIMSNIVCIQRNK